MHAYFCTYCLKRSNKIPIKSKNVLGMWKPLQGTASEKVSSFFSIRQNSDGFSFIFKISFTFNCPEITMCNSHWARPFLEQKFCCNEQKMHIITDSKSDLTSNWQSYSFIIGPFCCLNQTLIRPRVSDPEIWNLWSEMEGKKMIMYHKTNYFKWTWIITSFLLLSPSI